MKKTWKKLIFTALFSALLLENPALPLKEAVSLTAEAATPALSRSAFRLTRGKTRILRLKNASGTVRWTSSNKAVATVTSKGVVKASKQEAPSSRPITREKPINVRSLWKPRNYPPPR